MVVVTGSTPPSRLVGGRTVPAVGVWVIDPDHAFVGFRADRLGRAGSRGRFMSVAGHVDIGAEPADSSVEATVATANPRGGSVEIDTRLHASDLLDVDRHPFAVFSSTAVEWDGRRAGVSGLLTLVGVTDTMGRDVRSRGTVADPWGRERSGPAGARIDRDSWGFG